MRFFSAIACFSSLILFYTPALALHIGVSQLVEHPSLNEIRSGLTDTLKKNFGDKLKITYLNANGDNTVSMQIANQLIGLNPDLVVGITTVSAQHLLAKKPKMPMVFSGVNDPVKGKLLKNADVAEENVTGVILDTPLEEPLKFIKSIKQNAKNIGFIYNPGEANSVSILESFTKATRAAGLNPVPVTASQSSQVISATQSLVGKVDAIYLPTDNTVISSLGTVLQVTNTHNIPVLSGDVASVEQGALAAFGSDHYQLGVETAKIVGRILKGEATKNIKPFRSKDLELHLNLKYANDKMGICFPPSALSQAKKITAL